MTDCENEISLPDDLRFLSGEEDKPLCAVCRSISFSQLRSSSGFEYKGGEKSISGKETFCPLCMFLRDFVTEKLTSHAARKFSFGKEQWLRLRVDPYTRRLQFPDIRIAILDGDYEVDDEKSQNSATAPDYSPSRLDRAKKSLRIDLHINNLACDIVVSLTVDPSSPISHLFHRKTVPDDASSDVSFSRIQSWIMKCDPMKCMTEYTSPENLPTRLIDVGTTTCKDSLRLIITAETNIVPHESRYIALSYCWGSKSTAPSITTTAVTLASRQNGLVYDELPRTFQDAILMARKLGVRYLWIDALCILQGKDEEARADWRKESSRMAEVYSRSYLTIAAASSSNVHGGILKRKLPDSVSKSVKLRLSSFEAPEYNGEVSLGPVRQFRECMDEPLYRRAWTLQERVLSSRVLICNIDQFVWECQCRSETESGIEMAHVGAIRLNTKHDLDTPLNSFRDAWQCIATDYSARLLSVSSDKLPAISGLARKFSEVHDHIGGRYIAGVWENSLLDDLLWSHAPIDIGHNVPRGRPNCYRAPSWSWASVDGNVRWFGAGENGVGPYHITVVDYRIDYVDDEDSYGGVVGGFLKVAGVLTRSKITKSLKMNDRWSWYGPGLGSQPLVDIVIDGRPKTLSSNCFLDVSVVPGLSELEHRRASTGNDVDTWILRVRDEAYLLLVACGSETPGELRKFQRLGVLFREKLGETYIAEDAQEEEFLLL